MVQRCSGSANFFLNYVSFMCYMVGNVFNKALDGILGCNERVWGSMPLPHPASHGNKMEMKTCLGKVIPK